MLPREFRRRLDAFSDHREFLLETVYGASLMPTNHLRSLLNKPMAMGQKRGRLKPLTLDGLRRRSQIDPDDAGTKAEWVAMCEEIDRRREAEDRAQA